MKVSLAVASGAHQGKVVAITGPQFLIGRDPQCQLRPASQAVSKQHCAILVRDGKVFLQDFGSTNGSILNGSVVRSEERQLTNGDTLQVGPLDFQVRIELAAPPADGTPLPGTNPELNALTTIKAAVGTAPPGRDPTPTPKAAPKPAATPSGGSKEHKPVPAKPAPAAPLAESPPANEEHDRIAAMLLGLTDEGEVPEGSTVVDLPSIPAPGTPGTPEGEKKDEKKDAKKAPTKEDSSNAASEILRKYMRRPK